MRLDQDQLEWIVREVIRRLQGTHRGGGSDSSLEPAARPRGATDIRIEDTVVTTVQLEGRLQGVRRLHVAAAAVVTPAVRDLLRDRNVELVRVSSPSSETSKTTTA